MTQVDAIYRHGVFEPLGPVNLREDQRVRLNVLTPAEQSVELWLERVRLLQRPIVERNGNLPDSTVDIAADRTR